MTLVSTEWLNNFLSKVKIFDAVDLQLSKELKR